MRSFITTALAGILFLSGMGYSQVIKQDDFEGSGNINWGPLFYLNETQQWEENLTVVANPFGSGNVGLVQDADTSYTGAALVGGDVFSYDKLAIEADVYCYVNTGSSTSMYTGVSLMADTSLVPPDTINTRYVKLVADFDDNMGAGPRLRLYNSDLDLTTFQYTFDVKFYAADIPGGIPAASGWHRMRLEARTINEDRVEYTAYFDGNLVGGGPVYDTTKVVGTRTHHPYTSGTYGLFSFQQGAALPGYFDNVEVEELVTSIEPSPKEIAEGYHLFQNFPNPFNPSTEISFQIPSSEYVSLEIFNLLGQKVRSLVNARLATGLHRFSWNSKDDFGIQVPAGIYYYRLNAGPYVQTMKMMLLK